LDVLDFLALVWGRRIGWVDIPSKAAGHWIPFSASWPEDKALIARRVASCLEDDEDVYFSVAMFHREGRRLADTMSSEWLWADLDTVDPGDCAELGLAPTVAWESSPWRYQGLWKTDSRMRPELLARVNRALSYTLNADRGGWDLTQVLRPVGTKNFKYPGAPEVMLIYDDGPEYNTRELWASVRNADPGERQLPARSDVSHGLVGGEGSRVPARARALLATPAERIVVGERSNRLFELNCLLAEAGLAEDEIVALVADSAWNKWGTGRGLARLEKDVGRAVDHVLRKRSKGASPPSGGNGHKPPKEAARTAVEKVVRADQAAELAAQAQDFDLTEPSARHWKRKRKGEFHSPLSDTHRSWPRIWRRRDG
jgi:hypothetical protein